MTHDRHRRGRLHHHRAWCEVLGVHRYHVVPAPRRPDGAPLLRQRDRHAHGRARPAVEGLDGPGVLGAHVRLVRSRAGARSSTSPCSPSSSPRCRSSSSAGGRVLRVIADDLHLRHAPRRDAVAPPPVVAGYAADAHPAQGQRALVVGDAAAALPRSPPSWPARRWRSSSTSPPLAGSASSRAWSCSPGSRASRPGWSALYLVFQMGDLFYRGAAGAMLSATGFALLFWVGIGFGLLLPLVLLIMPEVRESRRGLVTACSLVVAGVLLHRLNVAVFGLRVRHWETYRRHLARSPSRWASRPRPCSSSARWRASCRSTKRRRRGPAPRPAPSPPARCAARPGIS